MSVTLYPYGVTPNGSVVIVDEQEQSCYYFSEGELELIEAGFIPASLPENHWKWMDLYTNHDLRETWPKVKNGSTESITSQLADKLGLGRPT